MLLSVATRKKWFSYLGLGNYNRVGILKMQKRYFTRLEDQDGIYSKNTDILLRHLHHVKLYAPDFRPEEFRCGCGSKYCTGYPTWMRSKELKHIQTIRSHYGRPMTITSGLRCREFNRKLDGSSSASRHLAGYAVDFYMQGVTDNLEHRRKAIKYIKQLKNHHYTYGDGIDSNGRQVHAPGMGNALHTDVK